LFLINSFNSQYYRDEIDETRAIFVSKETTITAIQPRNMLLSKDLSIYDAC